MAIQINKILTKSGVKIPSGSMIKPNVTFPDDIIKRDDDGVITEVIRVIQMGIPHYPSKEAFLSGEGQIGQVDQFPAGFGRAITPEEYQALSGPNALLVVEGWLKDWLEGYLGAGTCVIIDAYN